MARKAGQANSKVSGDNASLLARDVGRRIKEARLQVGLSRRDFAARLGVSAQQIHKYEIGQDAVPLHRLLIAAKLFGVPPETFWSEGAMAVIPSDVTGRADISTLQLVRAYRRIGDVKVRRRLLQLVKQMADNKGAEEPAES
jgi:transcriptional regulator with XRE-family HTH domain